MLLSHQHKGARLAQILGKRYQYVERTHGNVRFALADSDAIGRRMQFERLRNNGVRRFFVYPHSARPSMINDMWPAWAGTTAQIVVNKHHEEVLRGYGYEKNIIHSGWYLTPVREFMSKQRTGKIRVLFGPIHPKCAPQDQRANAAVFNKLLPLVSCGEIDLTIRFVGLLQDNNIPHVKGVTYMQATMDGATEQIEKADVVIGHQTFAWMAVALGVPTVMMAEDMPTHFRSRRPGWTDTPSWNNVAHLFRYPLDILDGRDALSVLEYAMCGSEDVQAWKSRMIGNEIDEESFLETMEAYL